MKNKLFTRIAALALTGVMALSFAACGETETNPSASASGKGGKVFSEPTSVKVFISSNASYPYDEEWALWKYFSEATGAQFEIQAVPNTDVATKINLMMSSPETLPDLLYADYKKTVDMHATSGAFISLSDNFDKMPNMMAFLDKFDDEVRKELLRQRVSSDGKIYQAPMWGTHTIQNLRSWLYRKDIFEKHNLAVPTTMDELYTVAKKLKEIYPDSYPIAMRDGIRQFQPIGAMWKKNMSLYSYYDYEQKKWLYGAQQPECKEIVEYFYKCFQEGLVMPDYPETDAKSWEELICTDRGFIMPDYLVRIDFFNNICRNDENPNYTWEVMEPPLPSGEGKQRLLGKTNVDYRGYVICNTGDEERMDNAFKVLDWMYTDDAYQLLSWGKEGETYEVVDGKKRFIIPEGSQETAQMLYGVATTGLTQYIAPEAFEASYSDEQQRQGHMVIEWNEINTNPADWLAFPKDIEADANNLYSLCQSYTWEMISKFMIGQEPLSKWDEFQANLIEMGVEDLLKYYEDAYATVAAQDFLK